MEINGGLREGNNLFHSFSDFNIPEGMEASFQNAIDIENIFTRVTGDSISNINGILSTQGAANFFLMNPNGIVFGENASINVGGSFMATTADSINFEDGTSFAANDTSAAPILTTNEPSGLTFDGQPGAIQVYGEGIKITPDTSASSTEINHTTNVFTSRPQHTLSLIGNGITITGERLSASEGDINLASIGSGVVGITKNTTKFAFSYDAVDSYQDITITDASVVDTSGSGNINISGSTVNVADGSLVLMQNQSSKPSGELTINASSTLSLSGTAGNGQISSGIRSEALEENQGANINISTGSLLLEDAGRIGAATYGSGAGGNVEILATQPILFLENTNIDPERSSVPVSGISTVTYNEGDAGSLQISTPELNINNGGSVQSSTTGTGSGADVIVNADKISVNGINATAGRENPTAIAAPSVVSGSAGNIFLNASTLEVTDGAVISSSSFGTGDAGSVTINARDTVRVNGATGRFQSSITSGVTPLVNQGNDSVQENFGLSDAPDAVSGDVTINTSFLEVGSQGLISVENEGIGSGGTVDLTTNTISLNNTGSITASSASGQGGNINLNTDNLQIDNESTIEATAENQGGGGNININASNITAKKDSAISANATGGDGGNVTINSDILLGIDNSDLTANAIEGDGGNITINADFIIGFEERVELTPFSDIVASSEFGQSGTININSPESTAEEDATVNAREIESVEAGEFLKAVCPNPDNRYGKKTFQYYARGVPEGLGNYHDYDEEEILKDLPVHQKIERETYRHSTEPPSLPDANSIPDTYPDYPDETFEGRAEPVVKQFPYTTSPLQVIYSETNQVPPTPRPRKPGEPALEANAVQINPDGSKHFIRVAQIEHPQEQMCVRSRQTYSSKK